ncbi:unnamed protein product [Mytilus edulis]|uniref:Uncharacterized protein n=1 Tax=Mytilus edulis TaxID=6550 RepID=A0A8S3SAA2_MYTED|nr:unnamed protein product [Mytilus edulis]
MLRKYSPGADAGFENMNRKEIDFPLLCKLTKGKSIEEIKELFSNPVCFIKNDLNELRNKNNLQFCIIALCTLFDNSFEAKWLQGDVMPKNVKSAAEEIGLDLKKESTIKYVQEEFEKQDLLYLSKTELRITLFMRKFTISRRLSAVTYTQSVLLDIHQVHL